MRQEEYISLIYKKLSDEINDEELIQLTNWINASEENKLEFEQMEVIWEQCDVTYPFESVDTISVDDEFVALMGRINDDLPQEARIIPMQSEPVATENQRKKRMAFWKIAAGFALLIGLGSALFFIDFGGSSKWATIETTTESKEIKLADGSIVYLNSNSKLKYPLEFTEENRKVEFEGEGFFEIAPDKNHPFIVTTPYEDVTVLGTSFNVRAYANEPNSEVFVVTGKVQVNSGVSQQILLPNEKIIVDHSSGVFGTDDNETLNDMAWRTKTLDFKNAPLKTVIQDLESFYKVSISVENQELYKCLFASTFENEDLSVVFESLKAVLGVTVNEVEKGKFVLTGGGCQ